MEHSQKSRDFLCLIVRSEAATLYKSIYNWVNLKYQDNVLVI